MFVVGKLSTGAVVLALAVSLLNSSCGGTPDNPTTPPSNPSNPGGPAGGTNLTGRERLAWDQPALDSSTLASFRYAAYVDGTRSELSEVSCDSSPGSDGFACTAKLPPMSRGAHTLEIAAFVMDGDTVLESDRSSGIPVNATVAITLTAAGTLLAADGMMLASASASPSSSQPAVQFRVELVAEGLADPTDMAFAPDGRIFVAERAGTIRIVQQDRLVPEPALQLNDVAAAGGDLIAIAVDPQFAANRFVYTISTAPSRRDGLTFRLARFREVRGTLGEGAILLEGVPANAGASAALRIAKDGKIYAAFDDHGDASLRARLSSFNGKVLRLSPDGSTPGDSAAGTPVYSFGFQSPRGLDWQPDTGLLWLLDRVQDGAAGLHAIVPGSGRSVRGTIARSYVLPVASDTTAMAFYHGSLLPAFEGNLFIARERSHHILRVWLDGQIPPNIVATEPLLQDRVGAVGALGIGPRGEIYFTSDNALGRIVAE
jgi:glucose/arabinose dehydrogenase